MRRGYRRFDECCEKDFGEAEKLLSSTSEDKKSSSASASDIAEVAIAVDKDGKRLITLEAEISTII